MVGHVEASCVAIDPDVNITASTLPAAKDSIWSGVGPRPATVRYASTAVTVQPLFPIPLASTAEALSPTGTSTRPSPVGKSSASPRPVAVAGTSATGIPRASHTARVASPTTATLAGGIGSASDALSALATASIAATALRLVTAIHAYSPAHQSRTARPSAAESADGSMAMNSTSIGVGAHEAERLRQARRGWRAKSSAPLRSSARLKSVAPLGVWRSEELRASARSQRPSVTGTMTLRPARFAVTGAPSGERHLARAGNAR